MSARHQETIRQLFMAKLRELGLHQNTLATVLDVSSSSITRKLSGEYPFKPEEVQEIAKFLDIPALLTYPVIAQELPRVAQPYDPAAHLINQGMSLLASQDRKELLSMLAFIFAHTLPQSNIGPILRSLASQAS